MEGAESSFRCASQTTWHTPWLSGLSTDRPAAAQHSPTTNPPARFRRRGIGGMNLVSHGLESLLMPPNWFEDPPVHCEQPVGQKTNVVQWGTVARFLFDMFARWRDHDGNEAQLTPWRWFGGSALTSSTKSSKGLNQRVLMHQSCDPRVRSQPAFTIRYLSLVFV